MWFLLTRCGLLFAIINDNHNKVGLRKVVENEVGWTLLQHADISNLVHEGRSPILSWNQCVAIPLNGSLDLVVKKSTYPVNPKTK